MPTKLDRRSFLQNAALASAAMVLPTLGNAENISTEAKTELAKTPAGKKDKLRIGFIGVGLRGQNHVEAALLRDDCEVVALADPDPGMLADCLKMISEKGRKKPDIYDKGDHDYLRLLKDKNIDAVVIATPWEWHTQQCVAAMQAGKYVGTEVCGGFSLDECWQLVETSEKTRNHCMMLENCCYDFFELMTLNMARQDFFGEVIHTEGAYIHGLLGGLFLKDGYADMWRLKENFRNGNLYPTHGLGPVCQVLNINRGDQMEYLTSMQTNDFQMAARAAQLAETDTFYKEYVGKNYRGNMNTTLIRTRKGKTIMVQHDVTSPRPYSRIHLISGTKGFASKYPEPARVSNGHSIITGEEMEKLKEQYNPEIVKFFGERVKEDGGHGGADFMMDWRLIDCLRNGLPLDQDVYDAALWSAIAPLSEASVANRSNAVEIPDFTRGSWKTNLPFELTLKGGGTTRFR